MTDAASPVVIFVPTMAVPPWWARPLHYQHCYLAQPSGDNTLVLHHEGLFLRTEILPESLGLHLHRMMRDKAVVAWTTRRRAIASRPMLRPPMTCVEVVKAALGIAAPWIFTPRQLERHLICHGATRALPLT